MRGVPVEVAGDRKEKRGCVYRLPALPVDEVKEIASLL